MPDGIEIIKPYAVATLSGAPVKVDTVTANLGINSFPSVRVGFHDATIPDSGVLKMAGPDVASRVETQQDSMFSAQNPNSSIFMHDGGNSLEFKGYISSPNYSLGVQNVGFSTNIVHEASAITGLNASIYTNKLGTFRDSSTPMKPEIPEGLNAILDLMIKKWIPIAPDEETKAIIEQIHLNNTNGLSIWKKILDNSAVTWPELKPLLGYGAVRENMQDMIQQAYLNSYNDFFQTMQQFQAMFSMIYVPSIFSGEMGKFVSADTAVAGDGEELKIKLRSINMVAGPRSVIPLAYVAVRGPRPQQHRDQSYGHIISRWPKTAQSTGQVVEIGTPSWLPNWLVAGRQGTTSVGDTLSLKEYREGRVNKDRKLYETIFKEVGQLLERWAKQHYIDFALAASYAEVVTDLNLKIEPGKRYNVASSAGNLFKGFLVGVEHGLCSKPNQLQAYTRLRFSHIEAGGFSLPNKV